MITRDDRLFATKLFIENHSAAEIAEFLVNLQDAISGLSKNLEQYQAAYLQALGQLRRGTPYIPDPALYEPKDERPGLRPVAVWQGDKVKDNQ